MLLLPPPPVSRCGEESVPRAGVGNGSGVHARGGGGDGQWRGESGVSYPPISSLLPQSLSFFQAASSAAPPPRWGWRSGGEAETHTSWVLEWWHRQLPTPVPHLRPALASHPRSSLYRVGGPSAAASPSPRDRPPSWVQHLKPNSIRVSLLMTTSSPVHHPHLHTDTNTTPLAAKLLTTACMRQSIKLPLVRPSLSSLEANALPSPQQPPQSLRTLTSVQSVLEGSVAVLCKHIHN